MISVRWSQGFDDPFLVAEGTSCLGPSVRSGAYRGLDSWDKVSTMFTEITRRNDTRKHTILRYGIGSDVQELRILRIVMATTKDYHGILQTAQSS